MLWRSDSGRICLQLSKRQPESRNPRCDPIPCASADRDPALSEDEKAREYKELLTYLSTQPVVNLTGFTNTDLKLEYGTANITPLSQYDQNYTVLVRTLQQWADLLLESGLTEDAETVLAYAVSIGTDVSHTYYALAKIYAGREEYDKIADLILRAEELRSALRNSIVRTLQESYPQACSHHCG